MVTYPEPDWMFDVIRRKGNVAPMTALMAPHVIFQPYSKMHSIHISFPQNSTRILPMWKGYFLKCLKTKKSHLHKYSQPLPQLQIEFRCILFPLMLAGMFQQLSCSPPELNSADLDSTCLYKGHSCQCTWGHELSVKSKALSGGRNLGKKKKKSPMHDFLIPCRFAIFPEFWSW